MFSWDGCSIQLTAKAAVGVHSTSEKIPVQAGGAPRASHEGVGSPPGWLKIHPTLDPLRKNSRFQKLVAGK